MLKVQVKVLVRFINILVIVLYLSEIESMCIFKTDVAYSLFLPYQTTNCIKMLRFNLSMYNV